MAPERIPAASRWPYSPPHSSLSFFFFNDTATTEIYTLSLHDALPICTWMPARRSTPTAPSDCRWVRSEEHTSELQSPCNLVCRLLLEKTKTDIDRRLLTMDYLSATHRRNTPTET